MSGIRSRNTKPELMIRHGLHRVGFRFRLHDRSLRGTPDVVLRRYNAAIFVHGCFWHGHDCSFFRMPATRPDFWKKKIGRNRANDDAAREQLLAEGWRVLTVWECALRGKSERDIAGILRRIAAWLKSSRHTLEIREPERKAA